MNKKGVLKNFIENNMGEILREKLSADEFKAVIQGIFMIMEEASAGKIANVYDAIDLVDKFQKKLDCEGCKEIKNLSQAIEDKENIISIQRRIIDNSAMPFLKVVE